MKRFKIILERVFSSGTLLWVLPFLLIVPNVALDITEFSSPVVKAANILLPLGLYLFLMSLSRKSGRTGIFMFPFFFFAAFQIVLLFLYGESIIAVDMYLNMVTTSAGEVTELLGNLGLAIMTVIILYLCPLIWAAILWSRDALASTADVRSARRTGLWILALGIITMALCWGFVPRFNPLRDIFPANVVNNLCTAVKRTDRTMHYFETSAGFDYDARSSRPRDLREIYVLVIGETSRADHWALDGYSRPTNPKLSRRRNTVFFPKAVSESNTTHKSVPLALSHLTPENFGDSIYYTKGLVSAFNGAGFRTAWLSNQGRNRSFIDFFAREAQVVDFIKDDGRHHYDHELIQPLKDFIDASPSDKIFVVLHTYGSHFNYTERYTSHYSRFVPDSRTAASRDNLPQLINAYDNTILYTDATLDAVIGLLDSYDCPSAMLYFSDHGEDIFDDPRNRFLHSSPVPTSYQIHVPMLLWVSNELDAAYPDLLGSARAHRDLDISSSGSIFDTMQDIAGISGPFSDHTKSIVSPAFRPATHRVYLNDYNEGVPIRSCGLRDYDLENFQKTGISCD